MPDSKPNEAWRSRYHTKEETIAAADAYADLVTDEKLFPTFGDEHLYMEFWAKREREKAMSEQNEKPVNVTGPVFGIFSTVCEVLESPSGPEYKLFRFKDGCKWEKPGPKTTITVYSHWSEFDVGTVEGRYRVCGSAEGPPGYVAVLEGTAKPKPTAEALPVFDASAGKCEQAIINALEREPRIHMRALKKKCHAERFGGDLWDKSIKGLTDSGEIRVTAEEFGRVWIELPPDAPKSAPIS